MNIVEKRKEIDSCEIAWVGGFNPQMQSLMKNINGEVAKIHHTYRLFFNEEKEVKLYKLGSY